MSARRPARWCLVALWVLASACASPPTEVLVVIDAQPTSRALARALRVRVLSDDRARVVLDATRTLSGASMLPLTVPLIPEGGDASRSFVVEATLLGASGAVVSLARAEGTYVEGEVREIVLCVFDVCRGTECGTTEPDCADTATCRTCVGPTPSCVSAAAESFAAGSRPAVCPAPDCTPSVAPGAPEATCDDGIDDDCDAAIDCVDDDCTGVACGLPGEVCAGGECRCSTAEVCDDGVSNDCDGETDCADADCAGELCDPSLGLRCNAGACSTCSTGTNEICDNSIDDDCDGYVDCEDPECCADGATCGGHRCRGSDSLRCCGGACVAINTEQRCGGCRVSCLTAADGHPYQCVRVTSVVDDPIPRYSCRCSGDRTTTYCSGDLVCRASDGQTLCNCNEDADCATSGMRCDRNGDMHQNYCR